MKRTFLAIAAAAVALGIAVPGAAHARITCADWDPAWGPPPPGSRWPVCLPIPDCHKVICPDIITVGLPDLPATSNTP